MAKHGWKGFGIHPHIAENQPHEVNTLGMNHPVESFILILYQFDHLNLLGIWYCGRGLRHRQAAL